MLLRLRGPRCNLHLDLKSVTGPWSNFPCLRSTPMTLTAIQSPGTKTTSKIWTNTSTMALQKKPGATTAVRCRCGPYLHSSSHSEPTSRTIIETSISATRSLTSCCLTSLEVLQILTPPGPTRYRCQQQIARMLLQRKMLMRKKRPRSKQHRVQPQQPRDKRQTRTRLRRWSTWRSRLGTLPTSTSTPTTSTCPRSNRALSIIETSSTSKSLATSSMKLRKRRRAAPLADKSKKSISRNILRLLSNS